MLIRTVLDCRSKSLKFYTSIYLLVASWDAVLSNKSRLEIVYLGELPTTLRAFLERYQVAHRQVQPDPELVFAPTGNTLLGATYSAVHDRVLLVDNDVIFLNDAILSQNIPDNTLAGGIAGVVRVSQQQWEIIENEIGLSTLPGGQIVDSSQLPRHSDGVVEITHFPRTYINGGVLLLPKNCTFADVWKDHIIMIHDHFKGTNSETVSVCRSNMAGLATAAASHGKFEWLDAGANYRHFHFLMNARSLDAISIIHLTGDTRSHRRANSNFILAGYIVRFWQNHVPRWLARRKTSTDQTSHISNYVSLYWQNRIFEPLSELKEYVGPSHFQDASTTAHGALDRIQTIIQEYDLDAKMHRTIAEVRS